MTITLDAKTIGIGLLSLSGLALLAGHLAAPPAAYGIMAVNGDVRDYAVATAATQTGGDAVYVLDNRSGLVALFGFDQQRRGAVVQDVRPMADLLGGAAR